MGTESTPIVVDFPLRGKWVAASTPAERIPSHGTDFLGQRYAYDFLRIEESKRGFKFFRGSMLRYLLVGVRLSDCYGWSESIHAPFDGTIVTAVDGWPERKRLHFLTEIAVVLKNSVTFNPKKATDLGSVLGNHIIIKMRDKEVYAFFAHARCGSLRVCTGKEVHTDQHLADVGHSGNSMAPHLHFHLMDRASIVEAQGLPCCSKEYEALHDSTWCKITEGIPGKREFIGYAP